MCGYEITQTCNNRRPASTQANAPIQGQGKEGVGSAYGIRTRGLHLERVVSLAARRMRHATTSGTDGDVGHLPRRCSRNARLAGAGWGSGIRTPAYRSRVCRPTARRIPNLDEHYSTAFRNVASWHGAKVQLFTNGYMEIAPPSMTSSEPVT